METLKSETAHVVTLFNSMNCGAYLQALALGEYLGQAFGLRCRFVDTGARSVVRASAKQAKLHLREVDLRQVRFDTARFAAYAYALRRLDVERTKDLNPGGDLIVFGSDEIWNVSRPGISRYPMLWGQGVAGGRKVAYAPSTNGASLTSSALSPQIRDSLRSFSSLSGRDEATAEAVAEVTGRAVPVVCDPTLLHDAGFYRTLGHPTRRRGYVLVYAYPEQVSEKMAGDVREYARGRDLRVVSADRWLPWCDECVPCGPLGFLGLVDGADAMVTTTFHGTAFAAIFGKDFASYAGASVKVAGLLGQLGLGDRDPSRRGGLHEVLSRPLDAKGLQRRVAAFRADSEAYLRRAVAGD